MSRIIIDNQSSRPDTHALRLVAAVVEGGKISNNGKQHCYHTAFSSGVSVSSFLNKTSERFVVMDIEEGT
jgi:hypothetical protein